MTWFRRGLTITVWIFVLSALGVSPRSWAQVIGTGNPNSPYLPFVYLPTLQAEARATLTWVEMMNGREIVYSPTDPARSWNLKDDFHINKAFLFLDTTVRLTAGPFSFRLCYEPRAFLGVNSSLVIPESTARLEYSGARIGGDIDLARWYGSRAGFDFDYDLFQPILTEGIGTPGGKRIIGEAALTIGLHADLTPAHAYWGMVPCADAYYRWAVLGSQVSDLRVAAGVKFPETVLGIWALKIGYRRTSLDFRDFSGKVDVTFGGLFGELAYYY